MRSVLPLLPLLGALLASPACGGGAPSSAGAGGTDRASSSTGGGAGGSIGGAGGAAGGAGGGGGAPAMAICNQGLNVPPCNPYGVELGSLDPGSDGYWSLIKDVFQVHFYRPPALFLDQLAKDPMACAACDEGASRGLYLVLVVRNDGGPLGPSHPPTDLGVYEAAVGSAIDRYHDALAVVVIEDEPSSPSAYAGSAADYLAQLAAGCKAAHARHARCADGGVDSTSLLYFLADYYRGAGFAQEPLRILKAAKSNPSVPQAFKDGTATVDDAAALLLTHQAEIARARQILGGLRAAGVDYVNFHWYEEGQDTLDELISVLRTTTGCNALLTDELGQRAQDGAVATYALMDARELGLAFVVWSSREPAPVTDAEGALLPSGEALKKLSTTAVCGD